MAAGYIGKISAVVTANTSDLTKKLNDAGTNTKRFAETLNRSISSAANSAQNSLQKIFTPLQNIERRLQTSLKIPGLDLPVEKIRQAVSITEQINKPLAQAASGFTNLSLEVQGAFLPALQRAQDQAVSLNLQLQNTGKVSAASFAQAQRSIDDLIAAQSRLQQAQSLAARSMTGRELQFANPGLFQALQASSSLTAKAGSLPAARLADGVITKSVKELNQYQQVALQAQARLESLRLDPKVDPTVIEAQRKRVENLVETIVRAQARLTSLTATPKKTVTTTDPSGRTIPQRLQEINAVANARRLERDVLNEITDAEARAKLTTQQRLAIANELLTVTNRQVAATGSVAARRQSAASRFSDTFGGPGVGLNTVFAEKALQGYAAQLQILQGALGKVSLEARGPAALSFAKLRDEITRAMNKGELETEQTRAKLKSLTQEAVAATAAVANINATTLGRSVARAGDIGRRGFDKFSLAANQAAFAIDDFFSSTGGVEFKLRAVQNNLTQLGFILGGTKGLFTALGAVIGGQVLIGIVRFAQGGASARDVSKGLNDALKTQKSVVDDLKKSFDSLASSIANTASSGSDALKSSREIELLQKQASESRAATVSALAPDVVRERIRQNVLETKKTNLSDIGYALSIERQLQQSKQRQAEAEAKAIRDPLASGDLTRLVLSTVRSIDFGGSSLVGRPGARETRLRLQESLRQTAGDPDRLAKVLQDRIDELTFTASRSRLGAFFADVARVRGGTATEGRQGQRILNAREDVRRLSEALGPILALSRRGADTRAISALETAGRTSRNIATSREAVSEIPGGAGLVGLALDAASKSLQRSVDRIAEARAAGDADLVLSLKESADNLLSYTEELKAASSIVNLFSETLSKASDSVVESSVSDSARRLESSRGQRSESLANLEIAGALGIGRPQALADFLRSSQYREQSRQQLAAIEDAAMEAYRNNLALRQQFSRDAISGDLGNEVKLLADERFKLQQEIASGVLTPEQQANAELRQKEIDIGLERAFLRSDAGRQATDNAAAIEAMAQQNRLLQESQVRGERLIDSDGVRAAREVIKSIQDIENANLFARNAGAGGARARVLDEARRQAAPALFALQDAVANAVLQGPSRQALNAADISTQQGTAELNRLLRGDDPARDQNLLELQKQTNELVKLNATLGAAGVAD